MPEPQREPRTLNCMLCDVEFTTRSTNAKFCSTKCRKKASKLRRQAQLVEAGATNGGENTTISPIMREFRQLVEREDDFVRETLREVVRAEVTQAVRDNITGAAEVMTGMLPLVLAGLQKDLESKEPFIRSRAMAAVLKYSMQFRDTESDKEPQNITIVHNVEIPDTPLGRATAAEIITLEEGSGYVEEFEKDWPECHVCKERKHPDALFVSGAESGFICSSCRLAQQYKRGAADPAGFLTYDPELGSPD